jgi:hypothetical protein
MTTTLVNPNEMFSPNEYGVKVNYLKTYIQFSLAYKCGLEALVSQGLISQDVFENTFHDYLNDGIGLLDDEFDALAIISREYWMDETFNDENFGALSNFCSSNRCGLIDGIKKLISFLSCSQEEFNRQESEGLLTGDESCDEFSDLLSSYGLDYGSYVELLGFDWVESD